METNFTPTLKFKHNIFAIALAGLLLLCTTANAALKTSNAVTGLWNAAASWQGGVIPAAGDDVVIVDGAVITYTNATPFSIASLTIGGGTSGSLIGDATARALTVTGALIINAGAQFNLNLITLIVGGATTVNGALIDGNNTGAATFTGLFTVSNTGSFTTANTSAFTFQGGIVNNGTFNKTGTGNLTFSGTNQAIGGAGAISSNGTVTITGVTVTNNSTDLTLTSANAMAGTGTWVQGAGAVLNTAAGSITVTNVDFSTNANTVNYSGAAQTMRGTTYSTLRASTGGIKTGGTPATAVNVNLDIASGVEVSTGNFVLTLNGTVTGSGILSGGGAASGLVLAGSNGSMGTINLKASASLASLSFTNSSTTGTIASPTVTLVGALTLTSTATALAMNGNAAGGGVLALNGTLTISATASAFTLTSGIVRMGNNSVVYSGMPASMQASANNGSDKSYFAFLGADAGFQWKMPNNAVANSYRWPIGPMGTVSGFRPVTIQTVSNNVGAVWAKISLNNHDGSATATGTNVASSDVRANFIAHLSVTNAGFAGTGVNAPHITMAYQNGDFNSAPGAASIYYFAAATGWTNGGTPDATSSAFGNTNITKNNIISTGLPLNSSYPLVVASSIASPGANNCNWIGVTSTAWHTASNWSPAIVPNVSTANVFIANPAAPFQPVLNGTSASVNNVTVNGSGSTFATSGSPTLSIFGAMSVINSATATPVSGSTFSFAGGGAQNIPVLNGPYFGLSTAGGGNKTLDASTTVSTLVTVGAGTSLINNNTLTASTTTINGSVENNADMNISGVLTVNTAATLTNNLNLTLTNTGGIAGAGTIVNNTASSVFTLASATFAPVLTATVSGNIVNYNRAGAQTTKGTTYYDLQITGSGIKALGAATAVDHNLDVPATLVLDLNDLPLTLNGTVTGTGTFTGGTAAAGFVFAGSAPIGTINLTGAAQSLGFINFTNSSTTGTLASPTVTIVGALTLTSTATALAMNGNVAGGGVLALNGTLTISATASAFTLTSGIVRMGNNSVVYSGMPASMQASANNGSDKSYFAFLGADAGFQWKMPNNAVANSYRWPIGPMGTVSGFRPVTIQTVSNNVGAVWAKISLNNHDGSATATGTNVASSDVRANFIAHLSVTNAGFAGTGVNAPHITMAYQNGDFNSAPGAASIYYFAAATGWTNGGTPDATSSAFGNTNITKNNIISTGLPVNSSYPLVVASSIASAGANNCNWIGVTSTSWNVASNWSPAIIPNVSTANVFIANPSAPFQPTLDITASVNNVTVDGSGSTLTTSGTRVLSVFGALSAINSATVTPATGSTFLFTGGGAQNIPVLNGPYFGLSTGGAGNKTLAASTTVSTLLTVGAGTALINNHSLSSNGTTINGGLENNLDMTATGTVNVAGTLTNNLNLTFTNVAGIAGAGTIINNTASSVFTLASATFAPVLTATVSGNIVNYNRAGAQTTKGTTYYDLQITGSGIKTSGAATTVDHTLDIGAGAEISTGNFVLTLNGTVTGSGIMSGGSAVSGLVLAGSNGSMGTINLKASASLGSLSFTNSSTTGTIASPTVTLVGALTLNAAVATPALVINGNAAGGGVLAIAGALTFSTANAIFTLANGIVSMGNNVVTYNSTQAAATAFKASADVAHDKSYFAFLGGNGGFALKQTSAAIATGTILNWPVGPAGVVSGFRPVSITSNGTMAVATTTVGFIDHDGTALPTGTNVFDATTDTRAHFIANITTSVSIGTHFVTLTYKDSDFNNAYAGTPDASIFNFGVNGWALVASAVPVTSGSNKAIKSSAAVPMTVAGKYPFVPATEIANTGENIWVWTGATSTAWNLAANWLPNIVPNASDVNVYIINVTTNQPTLNQSAIINNLIVGNGEVLTLANVTLSVHGSITNTATIAPASGSIVNFAAPGNQNIPVLNSAYSGLVTSGGGTKTLLGNTTVTTTLTVGAGTTLNANSRTITFNGTGTGFTSPGTFSAGTSTFIFNNGNQTIPGVTFYNLQTATGGTKTLGGAATVSNSFGIGASTTYNGGAAQTLSLAGAFTNAGTFNGATGIIAFVGNVPQTSPAGITYVNLAINNSNPAGVSLLGATTVSGQLTLTAGPLNVGANTLTLSGAAIAGAGAATNLQTTSSSNLVFSGSALGVYIPASVNNLNTLTINNGNDVAMNGSITLNSTGASAFVLTNGVLMLGANDLTILSTDINAITGGTFGTGIMVQADGAGQLKRNIATGSYLFPIGDFSGGSIVAGNAGLDYSPVTLNFASNSANRIIGVRVTDDVHPQYLLGGPQTFYISRYWSFTDALATGTYTYAGRFNYSTTATSDLVGASYGSVIMNRYNGSAWSQMLTGYPAAPSYQVLLGTESSGTLNNNAFMGRVNTPQTYTWIPTSGSHDWQEANNWDPARGNPYSTDILQFNNAGTSTAVNVGGLGAEDILFTDVSANCTAAGSTLTKNSGDDNWNGGAGGIQRITTGGYIQAQAVQTNSRMMFGLDCCNPDFNWTSIDYAIYLNAGTVEVRESNSSSTKTTAGGTYTASDVFQVRINAANQVEYVKNGTVFYTSLIAPSVLPLQPDMSINDVPGGLTNIQVYPGESVDKIIVANNTNIGLEATAPGVSLTLGATASSTALTINNGSTLQVSGTGSNSLSVGFSNLTGINTSIAGNVIVNANTAGNNRFSFTNLLLANNTVTGNIINNGMVVSPAATVTRFAAGATYRHNVDGGAIPFATWDIASAAEITSATTGATAGLNQTFGNLTIASGSGAISNLTGTGTVAGTLTLTSGNLNLNGQQLNLNGNSVSGAGFLYSVSASSILSITGSGAAGTLGFAPGARTIGSLIMNRSGETLNLNTLLSVAASVDALKLTAGFVENGNHVITVTATAATSVSGGGAGSYVKGPLARALPTGTGGTYNFPVGEGEYNLFQLVAPVTAAGSIAQVEVIEAVAYGTPGAGLTSLSDRYWIATASPALTGLTGVSLSQTALSGNSGIGQTDNLGNPFQYRGGGPPSGGSITSAPVYNTAPLGFFAIGTRELTGTVTVGPGGTFASFTNAGGLFEAIQTATFTGDIIVRVTGDITNESGTFALKPWAESGAGNYFLIITPDGNSARFISNSSIGGGYTGASENTAGLFRFDGVKRVIVDGRDPNAPSSPANYLTFENISNAKSLFNSTLSLLNGAANNQIKYTTLRGRSRGDAGVVRFGTATGAITTNSNNSITNSIVGGADNTTLTALSKHGIVSAGANTLGWENVNDTIYNCNISNFYATNGASVGLLLEGAGALGNSNWLITGNTFNQSVTRTVAMDSAVDFMAISVNHSSSAGFTIENNAIGGTSSTESGTPWTQTGGSNSFTGIYVNAASASVQNNIIANIDISTESSSTTNAGIYAAGGTINIGTVTGNRIGGTTGNGISFQSSGAGPRFSGILATGATGNVKNNTITNISVPNGSATPGLTAATVTDINTSTGTATTVVHTGTGVGFVGGDTLDITNSNNFTGVQANWGLVTNPSPAWVKGDITIPPTLMPPYPVACDNITGNLVYQNSAADRSNGIAVFSGPTSYKYFNGTLINMTAKLTVKVTTPGGTPIPLTYNNSIVSVPLTQAIKVVMSDSTLSPATISFVHTGGAVAANTWYPSILLYDRINTPLNGNEICTGVKTGFFVRGTTAQAAGIYATAGVNAIEDNTISSISSNVVQNSTGGQAAVIGIAQTSAQPGQLLKGNTVRSLSVTDAVYPSQVTGIYYQGATTGTNIIERNVVHSFSSVAPGASQVGIYAGNGVAQFSNNIVRLGINAAGSPVTTPAVITGLLDGSSVNTADFKFYYNSVYLGGSGVTAGNNNTYGLRRLLTYAAGGGNSTLDIKNNIIVNARANTSGTGINYGVYLDRTGGIASNYNDIYTSAPASDFGGINGTNYASLAAWKSANPSFDANSISQDPVFVNAVAAIPDLHIDVTQPISPVDGAGTPVGGVTADFDGDARSTIAPDMGADEPCYTVTIANQPVAVLVCAGSDAKFMVGAGGSKPFSYQWQVKPNGSGTWFDLTNTGVYSNAVVANSVIAADTLIITAAPASLNGDTYRCVITNDCGQVVSNEAVLTVSEVTGVSATNTGPYTAGQTIQLNANNGYASYAWSGPLAFASGDQNPAIANSSSANNGTYTLTVTNADGCTASATTNVSVTGSLVYVWQGSVGVNGNDWFTAVNWNIGFVPLTCSDNVVIPANVASGNYPVLTATANIGDLQIGDDVRIVVDGSLGVCGNWVGATGTTAGVDGTGMVILNGSSQQLLAGKTQFTTLRVNNTQGAILSNGAVVEINNALELEEGNFNTNAPSATLRFRSTSSDHVAIINNFSAGFNGTLTGNIIAQRFYDVPSANSFKQHFMGSPVNAPAVSQFGASGTPGYLVSHANCYVDQQAPGSPFGTFFEYDESHVQPGNCGMQAWKVVTTGSAQNARGYSVARNGAGVLTLNGEANLNPAYTTPGLDNSNWTSTATYLNTPPFNSVSIKSGWHLQSNPYLAYLDIQSHGANSEFNDEIQIWETTGPNAGSYQPRMSGVDALIAPFQGYMVLKTSTATPPATYTIFGSDRTLNTATFYKQANDHELKIYAEDLSNGMEDVTRVAFNTGATVQFDREYDAHKLSGEAGRQTLYTLNSAGIKMSINTNYSIDQTPNIPMNMQPGTTGNYKFRVEGINSFDPTTYIYIEDKTTGQWTDLRQNPNYTFAMSTGENIDRFVLHFTPPVQVSAIDGSCGAHGQIDIVQPGTATWHYTLSDATTQAPVASGALTQGSPIHASVAPGVYTLKLTDNSNYSVIKNILVTGVQGVNGNFTTSVAAPQANQDIAFSSNAVNGTQFDWEFGDGTFITGIANPVYAFAQPGTYTVTLTVTNTDGCTATSTQTITVVAATGVGNIVDERSIRVWADKNTVFVDLSKLKQVAAVIEIYDAPGRILSSDKFGRSSIYTKVFDDVAAGYLMVSVKTDDDMQTAKVFISGNK